MNIYVGNLPPGITEQELRLEFAVFGDVASVVVINDKSDRGGNQRHGFVEMASKSAGAAAIAGLRVRGIRSFAIDVVEALPMSNRKASSGHRVASPQGQ